MHLTETKPHYTEAKLVSLLEEKGIGRPSTFSSLVEKIQERKYVKKETLQGQTVLCNFSTLNNFSPDNLSICRRNHHAFQNEILL